MRRTIIAVIAVIAAAFFTVSCNKKVPKVLFYEAVMTCTTSEDFRNAALMYITYLAGNAKTVDSICVKTEKSVIDFDSQLDTFKLEFDLNAYSNRDSLPGDKVNLAAEMGCEVDVLLSNGEVKVYHLTTQKDDINLPPGEIDEYLDKHRHFMSIRSRVIYDPATDKFIEL